MKLGYNLTTKQNWTLTSWLSFSVPASGAFTLSLEVFENAFQLVIRRRGKVYWTSGAWNNQGFPFLPLFHDSATIYQYNLNLVSDKDGMFLQFDATEGSFPSLALNSDGDILGGYRFTYTLFKDFCYGYESEDGCFSNQLPECRKDGDKFEQKSGDFIHTSSITTEFYDNASISIVDCMHKCWEHCSCVGFTTASSNGTGCRIWNGNGDFRVYESGKTWIWIVISVAVFIALLVSGFICYIIMRRRKLQDEKRKEEAYIRELTAVDSFNTANLKEEDGREVQDLKIFSFGFILEATNNFSSEKMLGEGGFGPVYKAWELWKEGCGLELKDPALEDLCDTEQFLRVIHVGLLCVQEGAADRPTMSDVISMLGNGSMSLPIAKQPAFFTGRDEAESYSSSNKTEQCSINDCSITVIEAR
uniref:Receptor protein kinase n=1 Tax=Solanum tuberosum TaxID=4113 RepID=M1AJH2_SOLTU